MTAFCHLCGNWLWLPLCTAHNFRTPVVYMTTTTTNALELDPHAPPFGLTFTAPSRRTTPTERDW